MKREDIIIGTCVRHNSRLFYVHDLYPYPGGDKPPGTHANGWYVDEEEQKIPGTRRSTIPITELDPR